MGELESSPFMIAKSLNINKCSSPLTSQSYALAIVGKMSTDRGKDGKVIALFM